MSGEEGGEGGRSAGEKMRERHERGADGECRIRGNADARDMKGEGGRRRPDAWRRRYGKRIGGRVWRMFVSPAAGEKGLFGDEHVPCCRGKEPWGSFGARKRARPDGKGQADGKGTSPASPCLKLFRPVRKAES